MTTVNVESVVYSYLVNSGGRESLATLAHMAGAMPWLDTTSGVASCGEHHYTINTSYVNKYGYEAGASVVYHEVSHLYYRHVQRIRALCKRYGSSGFTFEHGNVIADVLINMSLSRVWAGMLPAIIDLGGMTTSDNTLYRDYGFRISLDETLEQNAERFVALLQKSQPEPSQGEPEGQGGSESTQDGQPSGEPSQGEGKAGNANPEPSQGGQEGAGDGYPSDQILDDMRNDAINKSSGGKGKGTAKSDMTEQILNKHLGEDKPIDFSEYLRGVLMGYGARCHRTYSRASRRHDNTFILKGKCGSQPPKVLICIDKSGSMDYDYMQKSLKTAKDFAKTHPSIEVLGCYFDRRLHDAKPIRQMEEVKASGGTEFDCVVDACNKVGGAGLVIVLTDGLGDAENVDNKLGDKVLWLCYYNDDMRTYSVLQGMKKGKLKLV